MKRLIGFILIIISINSLGQNPSNYTHINGRYRWIAGMFDSTFHIPRYNGVPSGMRVGASYMDGALSADTLNHNLYFWSNLVWTRIAKYSDLATGSRFGVEDITPAENRSVDFTGTYTMGLRHMSSLNFDADSTVSSFAYTTFQMYKALNIILGVSPRTTGSDGQRNAFFRSNWNGGNTFAEILASPNGNYTTNSNYFRAYGDSLSTWLIAGKKYKIHNLSSGVGTKSLRYDPSNGEITYADTTSGGGIDSVVLRNDTLFYYINGTPTTITPVIPVDTAGIATNDLLRWNGTEFVKYTVPYDTVALASFGGGGADAGDTTSFATGNVYGSFFNTGSDTLIITNLRIGLQGTSPSVTVKIFWNDTLNVEAGATALVTSGSAATNIYTGTSVTSFDNTKIPPGVWVWCKTSAVTTKPTYMTVSLIGYKKRVYP